MKIVYIARSAIPSRTANSIHVMKMCQAFAAGGHDVDLIVPDQIETEPDVEDVFLFYGVSNAFDIKKIPWHSRIGGGWRFGLEAALAARRIKPDLVYGRHLGGCAISALYGLPVIFEMHTMEPVRDQIGRCIFSVMISRRSFQHVVVISNALAGDVIAYFPQLKDRIRVAHDGADPVSADVRPTKFANGEGRIQIGYVGQLYAGRGFEFIIKLANSLPFADFHIVGGDEERIEFILKNVNTPTNLLLHGFKSPAASESYRLASDILIAPYEKVIGFAKNDFADSSRWASPLKLFEYMAAGKPIICSRLPVFEEILKDGETCIFCPAGDLAAWTAAIQDLSDDSSKMEKIGNRAQKCFLTNFTWRHRAECVIKGI